MICSLPLPGQIHDAGECLGCFWYFESAEKARPGYFCYGHLTENWISGPYGREALPARAVHIDELPADVRERLKRVRFDQLCFADTAHIQPAEHAPCESWESAYMDVTGKRVGPIPGKEGEYSESYEELRDLEDEGIVVQPPQSRRE